MGEEIPPSQSLVVGGNKGLMVSLWICAAEKTHVHYITNIYCITNTFSIINLHKLSFAHLCDGVNGIPHGIRAPDICGADYAAV